MQYSSLHCKFFPIITGNILSLTCICVFFSRSILPTSKEINVSLSQPITLPLCFEDDTF